MELTLNRKIKTDLSTVGQLSVDGKFECNIIEDMDRGLTQAMSLKDINQRKKYGVTAIPSGCYEVALTFSNRFQKYLPLLINVPGFDGVRMHSGNKADDSLGCLLTGSYDVKTPNFVSNSRICFDSLFKKIKAIEKKEKIFITIS